MSPTSHAHGQSNGPAFDRITYDLQRPGADPAHVSFDLQADGHGRYLADAGGATEASAAAWQNITVSPATLQILSASAAHAEHCETRLKHIANTGQKRLTYVRAGVESTCTFNYSDDEALMKTVDAFQAMAETLQMGARLEHDHRYDRLSLDPDMQSLETQIKEGHAIEVQNIEPVLKSIAEDERVIDRVRRKAARVVEALKDRTPDSSASEAPGP